MARSGRFGRQPRSAPSLTNTLVAIAREYENQRAQNIMDAWQKGGTFEGNKATDELVLKFWRDKVKGVSKDDPLHDTYQNAADQLDYTIHESKMTAKYAQGKASDGEMVAFYTNWAKKVPKDSEFFRVLQRDAGQYMRNQRASSEAAARKAAEDRYQTQQASTQKQKEAGGEYMLDTMRRIAQSGNVEAGIAPAISAPGSGSDLTDFDPSDPGVMLRLISAITKQTKTGVSPTSGATFGTGPFSGTDSVLYHDEDGKPVTGKDVIKQLTSLDPHFKPGTPIDVNYVTQLLDTQMQGINERMARAKATGHMTDFVNLQKSKTYISTVNAEVAAMPVQKYVMEARADYDAVVADQSSSPNAVLKAWQTYSGILTKAANDPRIEANDNMRSRIMAEVNGTPGVPTLSESFTGLANGQFDPASAKDAKVNFDNIKLLQQQVDAVARSAALPDTDPNKVIWTYGAKDSNGQLVPTAGGRQVIASTVAAVQAGGLNTQVVTVSDPRGGQPLKMAVTAVPVYATAHDPSDPTKPLSATNANPVAYAYDFPKGTKTETLYGFQTNSGMVFSSNPPWGDQVKTVNSSKGGNHIEIDLTPALLQNYGKYDPVTGTYGTSPDLKKNAQLPGGFSITGAGYDGNGQPKAGQIVFDPQAATWATGTRQHLGFGAIDPSSDYASLTLATLMQDDEGHAILQNLDKNPAFKATLDADIHRAAGYYQDPSGQWLPGSNADPNKLAAMTLQQTVAEKANSFATFVADATKMWQRDTTGSPVTPQSPSSLGTYAPTPGLYSGAGTKLASDLVQNTPFAALGNAYQPGTNKLQVYFPGKAADDATAIKPVGVIKAPTYTPTPPTYSPPPPTSVYTPPPPQTHVYNTPYGTDTKPYDVTQDYHAGAR